MSCIKLINRFVKDRTRVSMQDLVHYFQNDLPSDEEIAYLSKELANSGDTLSSISIDQNLTADIASTGGPSSLSTLLTPLILRSLGFVVPKLGVKGRPAGAVDSLVQIRGYKIRLTNDEVLNAIDNNGYCHFIASENHTPLDALLFKFRSEVGAKGVPELVIASILSKKIAVNLKYAGLDVRISPNGNFGTTWIEAKNNSERFIRVASMLEMQAKCFLNDGRFPFQNYIGRGEALVAIDKILHDECDESLNAHFEKCLSMALSLCSKRKKFNTNDLQRVFECNLKAQGSSLNAFEDKVQEINNESRFNIVAQRDGFFGVDLFKIRSAIVWGQNYYLSDLDPFPDPCGIIIKKSSNSFVRKGEILISCRAKKQIREQFLTKINSSFSISDYLDFDKGYEVITNG